VLLVFIIRCVEQWISAFVNPLVEHWYQLPVNKNVQN